MKKLNYKVLPSLEEVFKQVDKDKPLAIDFETNGLYGEITLAQFYQDHWPTAYLVKSPEIIELSTRLKHCHLVAHNISYEVSTIQVQLGKVLNKPTHKWLPEHWDDTLLLAKLKWWQKEKFTLDACYTYLLGADPYLANELDKKDLQKSNWSGSLSEAQLTYAAIDVFYLLDLFEACKDFVNEDYYLLDKSATSNAFDFQTNGLPLNKDIIRQKIKDNQQKIDELNMPINVNSWQQVRPYIGEQESDGLALTTFALEGNERAEKVLKARKLIKEISFLNKYLDTAQNGRIYGKFTFTTKSGRGNCKDQNLQQLPRTTKVCFQAPEGSVLVMSDFAQLELRYICAVSGEPRMEKLFKEGQDMHTYTAEMMGVPRQQAKTCNFNLGYGGSANMLRSIFIKDANLLLPLSEVAALKKKWHNLWSVLTAWQDKATKDWRAGKPFTTVLGRKMYAKLYTDAMNLPIQGGSADIAKLAMHKMFKVVKEDDNLASKVKFINFVHDSFMWECPDDPEVYEQLAHIIANAMKEAWEELVTYTKIPDLPMPVDVLVGYNWGKLEYGEEQPKFELTK